jgi:hypothetical protein
LANLAVVLYIRTKIEGKWAFRKVSEELSELACGEYYLSWYVSTWNWPGTIRKRRSGLCR